MAKLTKEERQLKRVKFWDSVPGTIIVILLLLIVIDLLTVFVGSITNKLAQLGDEGYTMSVYLDFIAYWIVIIGVMLLVKRERPLLKKLGNVKGKYFKLLLLGALTGFIMNALCAFAAWLHKDIYIYYKGENILLLLAMLVSVAVQSGAEEILMRFFCYERLKRGYSSPLPAIFVSAFLFAIMHIFNDGVSVLAIVNIALIGLLYSLMIYYFDALWFCILHHTLWNFTQNIIFGLPNSGIVVPMSIFKLDASTAQDSFFYDVAFGVESTGFATVVIVLALVAVIFLGEKRKRLSK